MLLRKAHLFGPLLTAAVYLTTQACVVSLQRAALCDSYPEPRIMLVYATEGAADLEKANRMTEDWPSCLPPVPTSPDSRVVRVSFCAFQVGRQQISPLNADSDREPQFG